MVAKKVFALEIVCLRLKNKTHNKIRFISDFGVLEFFTVPDIKEQGARFKQNLMHFLIHQTQINEPGSLILTAGAPETELASKHGLSNATLDLEDLWIAFGFSIELKYESGIRLGFYIQMKPSRRTLGVLTNRYPPIVKHTRLCFRSRQIQRHRDSPQQSTRIYTASSPSPTGVHRNLQTKSRSEDGFCGKFLEIGLAQMKAGSESLHLTVRELILRRNEGDNSGLKRKVLKFDLTEAWRGRRMHNGASGLGGNGHLESKIPDDKAHERTGIHRCSPTATGSGKQKSTVRL